MHHDLLPISSVCVVHDFTTSGFAPSHFSSLPSHIDDAGVATLTKLLDNPYSSECILQWHYHCYHK